MQKLVSWQIPSGAWTKGYDYTKLRTTEKLSNQGIIDNKATTTEMRQVARAYRVTKRPEFLESFKKGLGFFFASQYPNGGWP
ncbi:MAG: hypothetical protein H7144_01135 [Burkholderiales bacterium]|nr:hypothetical protein [Phycisphaerae bacterium]